MAFAKAITPANCVAAAMLMAVYLGAAFGPRQTAALVNRIPGPMKALVPALLAIPYVLVAGSGGVFSWRWFALYLVLPPGMAVLLMRAAAADPSADEGGRQVKHIHGNWRDFLVLAVLGLAVDLRWFEAAWPPHLAIFGKMLLLDAGIYGFALRGLPGVGFDLRLRVRDLIIGARELAFYIPIGLVLGLTLGFLHLHCQWPGFGPIAAAWIFTFFFIAVPEELFFRGWLQNLVERRLGRSASLFVTAALFGLAHFNKRAAHFNWRYVLLAALAGVFYGRAWRAERRVGTSAITHASVDAIWSLWLR